MPKQDRLERAWAVLIDAKRSVHSIHALATKLGYDDLTEFNRDFRERFGVSPREIRSGAKKGIRFGPPGMIDR
jgi:transcriptional regulator GlxA family with amidase domain